MKSTEDLTEIITHFETILEGLNTIIKESGDYIAKNTIKFDSDIHSWD